MRTMLASILALLVAATTGAAPHRKHAAVDQTAISVCVHERTGPTGGISAKEAVKLCTTIAKHALKVERLAQRAAAAIEACELEVSIACEDTTDHDHDGGECSDETLRANGEFAVCTGHGPAFVAEGK